jgi:hypothetical protein
MTAKLQVFTFLLVQKIEKKNSEKILGKFHHPSSPKPVREADSRISTSLPLINSREPAFPIVYSLTSFDTNLFDDCQKAIYRLIETDSWPRFIRTNLYQRLVKKLTKREFCVEPKIKKKPSGKKFPKFFPTNLPSPQIYRPPKFFPTIFPPPQNISTNKF